jgi:hypothetical protein
MSALTLALAKSHLNIPATTVTQDAELQNFIDAAEAVIADDIGGPIEATAVTERISGGVCTLVLAQSPAVSLTSVTPYQGSALTLSDLYLDEGAGLVTYNSGAAFTARHYTVIYSAGRDAVPDNLLLAVKELVRHLWETQRGPTRRPGSSASDMTANTVPGAAYLFPHRVEQLLVPFRRKALA